MRPDKIFHVISNTHWDREWRFTFQRNRQMLVDMIDEVIAILLRNPEYRAFHLDSQTAVATDYLEARPHMRKTFIKLVQKNRLFIGPWFILPEQFQVGGENLIRNLLHGHKVSAELGKTSKIGYSPFSWGQISQLPQIYKEFGIELIMFYRGINSLDSEKAEFIWEGADGTRAISSRFSTMPRYNFYFYIYRPAVHNEQIPEMEHPWSKGVLFHFADGTGEQEDYYMSRYYDGYHKENIKPSVEAIIAKQADDFTTPHCVWMEGHDSSGPNEKTVQIIKDIKEIFPEINVVHSTLEDYAKEVFSSVDESKLALVTGERRSSQYDLRSGNMYGYTTSARMYLKQKNFETEKLLQFYAEPFYTISGLLGNDTKTTYLPMAWNYLLQNSAHDSIGGCSLDAIHWDMMWRYKQSIDIASGVFERACKFIGAGIGKPEDANEQFNNAVAYLVAVNPTTSENPTVVEALIDIPVKSDSGAFALLTPSGESLPVQIRESEKLQPVLEQPINRPMYVEVVRYKAWVQISSMKQLGYSTYAIVPVASSEKEEPVLCTLKKKRFVLENEFLKVRIERNGTLTIKDKTSGEKYRNLAYFHDEGEAGHAWVHKPVAPTMDTLESKPKIHCIENGPLSSTVEIKFKLILARTLEARENGTVDTVRVPLTLRVTLAKDTRRIDLKVMMNNKAEDHRFRMMFPTDVENPFHYGEGQFDVVKRSAERPDTSKWVEQPMYDFPMHQFVDVNNNTRGLAIAVAGLKEYELQPDKHSTLAITLLRSFRFIIAPSSVEDYSDQKGSQVLGEHTFDLSIIPHAGNWDTADIYNESLQFNNKPALFELSDLQGALNSAESFLSFSNKNFIFSSLKVAEDGSGDIILRVYNPTECAQTGEFTFFKPLERAEEVTIEELTKQELAVAEESTVTVSAQPKKIITLRLKLKNGVTQ